MGQDRQRASAPVELKGEGRSRRWMKAVAASLAMRLILSMLTVLGLTAVSKTHSPATEVGETASVLALIGDAACEDDSQCATIGVGAKACGGPEGYVAWSIARTDPHALGVAARRDADAARREQAKQNSDRGMVSDCSISPDPRAFCDIGRSASASSGPNGTCRIRKAPGLASPILR